MMTVNDYAECHNCYAKRHFAECYYKCRCAECCYAECRGATWVYDLIKMATLVQEPVL
jgi:hypothetical protein